MYFEKLKNFKKIGKDFNGICIEGSIIAKCYIKTSFDKIKLIKTEDKINTNKEYIETLKKANTVLSNNFLMRSIKMKLKHYQNILVLGFNYKGFYRKSLVARSLTTAAKTRFIDLNDNFKDLDNTKLYIDKNLRNGYQYINNNQILINNLESNGESILGIVEDDNIIKNFNINLSNKNTNNVNNTDTNNNDSYVLPDGIKITPNNDYLFDNMINNTYNTSLFADDHELEFVTGVLKNFNSINNVADTELTIHLAQHNIIKDYTCKFCIEVINFSYSPTGQAICSYFNVL